MNQKKHSNAHEKRVERKLSATRNFNSGASSNPLYKADLHTSHYIIECKCSVKRSISIKLDDIEKISQESQTINKPFIMHYEFQNKGSQEPLADFVLIPTDDFLNLVTLTYDYKDERESFEAMRDEFQSTSFTVQDYINQVVNKCSYQTRQELRKRTRYCNSHLADGYANSIKGN